MDSLEKKAETCNCS